LSELEECFHYKTAKKGRLHPYHQKKLRYCTASPKRKANEEEIVEYNTIINEDEGPKSQFQYLPSTSMGPLPQGFLL
jgi:hypothetical protein